MCKYCNPDSDDCVIFIDPLDSQFYFNHQTNEWDDYEDDFIYDRIYISYCPWCGERLERYKEENE